MTIRPREALILKADDDVCGKELGLIENQLGLLEIEPVTQIIESELHLQELFAEHEKNERQFDYVYLCAHGNTDVFGIRHKGKDCSVSWSKLALLLCTSGVLTDDAIIMLACCKGGFFKVASELMASCLSINAVCGVTWTVEPSDLCAGFVVFLYNLEKKHAEPRYAAQKATLATDYTFKCTTRDDLYENPSYSHIREMLFYSLNWIDQNSNWIETDPKIIASVDYNTN